MWWGKVDIYTYKYKHNIYAHICLEPCSRKEREPQAKAAIYFNEPSSHESGRQVGEGVSNFISFWRLQQPSWRLLFDVHRLARCSFWLATASFHKGPHDSERERRGTNRGGYE